MQFFAFGAGFILLPAVSNLPVAQGGAFLQQAECEVDFLLYRVRFAAGTAVTDGEIRGLKQVFFTPDCQFKFLRQSDGRRRADFLAAGAKNEAT